MGERHQLLKFCRWASLLGLNRVGSRGIVSFITFLYVCVCVCVCDEQEMCQLMNVDMEYQYVFALWIVSSSLGEQES